MVGRRRILCVGQLASALDAAAMDAQLDDEVRAGDANVLDAAARKTAEIRAAAERQDLERVAVRDVDGLLRLHGCLQQCVVRDHRLRVVRPRREGRRLDALREHVLGRRLDDLVSVVLLGHHPARALVHVLRDAAAGERGDLDHGLQAGRRFRGATDRRRTFLIVAASCFNSHTTCGSSKMPQGTMQWLWETVVLARRQAPPATPAAAAARMRPAMCARRAVNQAARMAAL